MTYGPEDFAAEYDVSRETLDRLKAFDAVLLDWSSRHNLVARSTLPERWERHYRDSGQLYTLIPPGAKTLVDMGSGAGFPGLVLAAMGDERCLRPSFATPPPAAPQDEALVENDSPHPEEPRAARRLEGRPRALSVTLVESTGKKSAFLAASIAAMRLTNALVIPQRIESITVSPPDVVTARALAQLDKLLAYAHEFAGENTVLIFPKGQDVEAELTAAAKSWHMKLEKRPSVTSPGSSILVIRDATPKAARNPVGTRRP